MDCERFESAMLDELYGELDELTTAAAKRHVAGCARCSARIGGLRATRRVATIPFVEPPDDLEERILGAAERARGVAPPRARAAEVISLAGSWAMRPQTAMAAVFLVMIGTSVLLLRGKSARPPASAAVTVTEQGTPAPADLSVDIVAATAVGRAKAPPMNAPPAPEMRPGGPQGPAAKEAPAAVAASAMAAPTVQARGYAAPAFANPPDDPSDDIFDAALRSYRAGHFKEAAQAFDTLSPSEPNAPDLWAARAIRDGKGCRAAVTRFDKTAQRYKQSAPGWDALLEGALCYRSLGDFGVARSRLNALLGVDSHKDRARTELDRIDELQQAQASGDAPAPKAASKPKGGAATTPSQTAAPMAPAMVDPNP